MFKISLVSIQWVFSVLSMRRLSYISLSFSPLETLVIVNEVMDCTKAQRCSPFDCVVVCVCVIDP